MDFTATLPVQLGAEDHQLCSGKAMPKDLYHLIRKPRNGRMLKLEGGTMCSEIDSSCHQIQVFGFVVFVGD